MLAEAQGIEARGRAEASAIGAKLTAEAEGLEKKAEAMTKMNQAAVLEMYFRALPEVARAVAEPLSKVEELHNHISLGLRMTTIIAFPASTGIFVLAEPILTLLYASQKASAIAAAPCLQIFAVGFVFLSIITTMTGALQGIGKQHIPVINLDRKSVV